MRTLQITLDEELLEQLESDDDALRDGPSAVIGRALSAWLEAKRRRRVAEDYRPAEDWTQGGGLPD
jgi:hypothetical protein